MSSKRQPLSEIENKFSIKESNALIYLYLFCEDGSVF